MGFHVRQALAALSGIRPDNTVAAEMVPTLTGKCLFYNLTNLRTFPINLGR